MDPQLARLALPSPMYDDWPIDEHIGWWEVRNATEQQVALQDNTMQDTQLMTMLQGTLRPHVFPMIGDLEPSLEMDLILLLNENWRAADSLPSWTWTRLLPLMESFPSCTNYEARMAALRETNP